ncbi:MAG: hypothetical protein HDQ87_02075 [Clostridia bacterium]|nr:hypothetical protein [Clostridia bacterium]
MGSLISALLDRPVSEVAVVRHDLELLQLNGDEIAQDITALTDGGVRNSLEMQGRQLPEIPDTETRTFFVGVCTGCL